MRKVSNPQQEIKLTVLGTASAMPVRQRNQSAQALQVHGRLFLFDCGEGVQQQFIRYGLPLQRLESIFISHIHGDHLFGIFGLLSTIGMLGRTAPLNIFAPASFAPLLKFFLSYYGEGLCFEIRFTPLKMKSPEVILDAKSFDISAFPLNHGIETFGFRLQEKEPMFNVRKEAVSEYGLSLTEIGSLKRGEDVLREDGSVLKASELAYKPFEPRSYAYVSDTAPFPQEAEWLRGTSLLYHECTYLDALSDQAEKRHHSTTLQAAAIAREAAVGKLVIGHYSSRNTDASLYERECCSIFPETYAASDGDVFEI